MNALTRELLGIIDGRIVKKRQANPRLGYFNAWTLVASERPDLLRAYNRAAGNPNADHREG